MSTHSVVRTEIKYSDISGISRIESCNETGCPGEGCCTVVTGIVDGKQQDVLFDCPYPNGFGPDEVAYMSTPRAGRAPTGQGKRLYVAAAFVPILVALKAGDYDGAIGLIQGLAKQNPGD
jgi:hypothetical protein